MNVSVKDCLFGILILLFLCLNVKKKIELGFIIAIQRQRNLCRSIIFRDQFLSHTVILLLVQLLFRQARVADVDPLLTIYVALLDPDEHLLQKLFSKLIVHEELGEDVISIAQSPKAFCFIQKRTCCRYCNPTCDP